MTATHEDAAVTGIPGGAVTAIAKRPTLLECALITPTAWPKHVFEQYKNVKH